VAENSLRKLKLFQVVKSLLTSIKRNIERKWEVYDANVMVGTLP
jgi:hypothetical protein